MSSDRRSQWTEALAARTDRQADTIREQAAVIEKLRAALEPFAAAAEGYAESIARGHWTADMEPMLDDDNPITTADLLAARAALEADR